MSNAAPAPSEQPAPEPTEVPASEQQPELDNNAKIETLSTDELRNSLFGERPVEAPAPAEAEPPAQEEPATEVTEPESEQPQEIEEPEHKPKGRISVRALPIDEQQQLAAAVEMVRNGEAVNVYAALQSLAGTAPAPATTPAQAPEEAAPAVDPVADIQTKLDELRAQRDQAEDDYDKPQQRRLTIEIENASRELAKLEAIAELKQQQQQQTVESYGKEYDKAFKTFIDTYDWSDDETSPLFKALDDKVTLAQVRKDPALSDPNYLLTFAKEIVESSKPKPAAKAPTPPAPAPAAPRATPAPPARTPVPSGGGVAPGNSAPSVLTKEETLHAINTASVDDLRAGLFGKS